MSKKLNLFSLIGIMFTLFLVGCGSTEDFQEQEYMKVGVMLSDVGLGDQSFSDAAFTGVMQARDDLNILFTYKELAEVETYHQGLTELVEEDHDLIIGLGFMVKEDLETVANTYPNQQFLLIDDLSELDNITSLVFKENEGSFLAGVVAGLKTNTNTIGFIGGGDFPLIHKFAAGFIQGVESVNQSAEVKVTYANDFGNAELGAEIANNMINNGADFIYSAAGYTGVGAINAAQEHGVYAIGVDSDQYFLAEDAVVTSMLKKVDTAIYQTINSLVEEGKISQNVIELGLKENGVGLAPIRVISLTSEEQAQLDRLTQNVMNGSLTIKSTME